MSAFIGGHSLETRVTRLLAPARPAGRTFAAVPASVLAPLGLAVALWGLPAVYEASEFLVRFGR